MKSAIIECLLILTVSSSTEGIWNAWLEIITWSEYNEITSVWQIKHKYFCKESKEGNQTMDYFARKHKLKNILEHKNIVDSYTPVIIVGRSVGRIPK